MDSASLENQLATGIVQSVHGVRGALKVRSYSGETRHFKRLKEIRLVKDDRSKRFEVESVRVGGTRLIIKLQGLDNREDAREFTGWELWVPRKHAARREKGEYYVADICGCRVLRLGEVIGEVRSVMEGSGRDFLEVVSEKGERWVVPMEAPFVGRIDTAAGTIELRDDWPL